MIMIFINGFIYLFSRFIPYLLQSGCPHGGLHNYKIIKKKLKHFKLLKHISSSNKLKEITDPKGMGYAHTRSSEKPA